MSKSSSKPKSPYKTVNLTYDEACDIRDQHGWEHIADVRSTHGHANIYWNNLTGELLYENHDDSNMSRLIKSV